MKPETQTTTVPLFRRTRKLAKERDISMSQVYDFNKAGLLPLHKIGAGTYSYTADFDALPELLKNPENVERLRQVKQRGRTLKPATAVQTGTTTSRSSCSRKANGTDELTLSRALHAQEARP